jgi:hypothetical protein
MPDEVLDGILEAEAKIVKREQVAHARSMLKGPYYKDGIAQSITVGKAKKTADGKALYINFEGTQHGSRIAEIAFINEFGKKGQSARPFIKTANAKAEDEAVKAGEDVYNRWLKEKGL